MMLYIARNVILLTSHAHATPFSALAEWQIVMGWIHVSKPLVCQPEKVP
jgi:hypothetical protein